MSDPVIPAYLQFLEELAAKIAAVLVDRGLAADLAREAARDCTEYIRRDWGGQKIYVPMDKARRNDEIASLWTGRNTLSLCREYHISESHLRRLHARWKKTRARR